MRLMEVYIICGKYPKGIKFPPLSPEEGDQGGGGNVRIRVQGKKSLGHTLISHLPYALLLYISLMNQAISKLQPLISDWSYLPWTSNPPSA